MKKILNGSRISWLIAIFPIIYMWYSILANNNGMRIFYFIYSAILVVLSAFNIKTGVVRKKDFFIIAALVLLTAIYIFLFADTESRSSAILFSFMYYYMWIYSNSDFRDYYYHFLKINEKRYLGIIIFYYVGFFVTMINGTAISHDWGTTSLQGPYGLAHIFAYETLLLSVNSYLLFIATKKNKWLIIIGINLIFMTLTNVRSTLLCLAVIIAYYFIVKKGYKKLLLFIVGCIAFYILYNYTWLFSTVLEKTANAKLTGDVTNARFTIWTNSINLFNTSDVFHKLFGNGMQTLMNYNLSHIRMQIHSHNEFIDILSAYGLVSFGFFIYVFERLTKGKNWVGFLLAFGVLAWFNGIYSDCSFVIGLISFRLFFEHINGEEKLNDTYV